MGTYRVPRDTKGESRILIIFSTRALIYTVVGVVFGYGINAILKTIGIGTIGLIIMCVLGLIGFTLATLKIPEISAIPITKEVAGEHIDEILIRYYRFRHNSKKVYIAEKIKKSKKTKEEEKNNGK